MFALIDCNNFYASCQRVFRPDLIGKPIVVLSNNDGCVIARSNEAKALNIPIGAVAYKYEKLFEENQVTVFSANFELYGDMSNRVMNMLGEYCPEMEIYSIDEAFLKFSGYSHFDLKKIGEEIQSKVTRGTGIPISVGIAPTKALAKVANRIAKKFPQETKNAYLIDSEEKRLKALKWLKVGDIWGIGRQHNKSLQAIGVQTAYEFTQLEDKWVKENLAIVGLRLKKDLEGIPTLDLEAVQSKKSIATTRSFETNYTKLEQLEERITTFAVSCAEKLRKQQSCCNSIMVFIHTNEHREELPQYHQSIFVKTPFATNSSIELAVFAKQALKKIFKPGYAYKRAGVIIQDFSNEGITQTSLFENRDDRHISLMKTIDSLNHTYGQQKVRLGSQDTGKAWKMCQEKLSPSYTTKWSDIIIVHV